MQEKIFELSTWKELNKYIQDLRDEIVRLKATEQDATAVSEKYAQAIRLKAEVMGMSKKEATALEGSYNALSQKMRELKEEYHATADAMRRQELAPQIRAIRDQLAKWDSDIGTYTRNIGNYASAFSQVRQVGGDLINGFRALSGVLTLTTASQNEANDTFARFGVVLNALNGAKGIGALIDGIKKYTTAAKNAETAQQALNTAMGTGGTVASAGGKKLLSALKNPEVLLALAVIAELVAIIVIKWDEVLARVNKWMGWTQKSKEEVDELRGSYDKFNDELERERRERSRQVKIMEAEKKSKKEILEYQREQIRGNIREANSEMQKVFAQMQEIKGHTFLRRLLNGENKLYKDLEEEFNQYREEVKGFYEDLKDINTDIKVGNITGWDDGKGGGGKNQMDEIVQAADTARKAIQKILNGDADDLEKVRQKYVELRKEVYKYKQAEIKAAKTGKEQIEIQERYELVRAVLKKQQTEEERQVYKEQFENAYKAYEQRKGLIEKEAQTTKEVYKGLVGELSGEAHDKNVFDQLVSEDKIRALEENIEEAINILENNTKDQATKFVSFVNEDFGALYDEMLKDEKAFAEKYPEPFIEALKTIGPLTHQIKQEELNQLKQFVGGMMNEVNEAVENGEYKRLPSLFEIMLKNKPISESPELTAAAQQFIQSIRKKVSEAVSENEDMSIWNKIDIIKLMWGDNPVERNRQILNAIVFETGRVSTEIGKLLSDIGQAWQANLALKQKDLDLQLENGRISKKQYDAESKRLKDSFDKQKGLMVASAIMSTAGAIMNALNVKPWYMAVIAAASAAATGAAQIAQIRATEYNGGTASGGSTPSLVDRTPYTSTVGLNPQDFAQASAEIPVKAYVVDHDLKEGLNNYDERINETTW